MQTALVTGGNRGIGLEICRQLAAQGIRVLLGCRSLDAGKNAAAEIDGEVIPIALDVLDGEATAAAVAAAEKEYGGIDILVNNAAILLDRTESGEMLPPSRSSVDNARKMIECNTLAPFRLIQQVAPGMRERGRGAIVNVSSGMGQLSDMQSEMPGYRMSKTALNAVTAIWAADLGGSGVSVTAACPGWVATDMGGAGAPRTVQEGADTIVWLATQKDDSLNGKFFRDRNEIPW